MLGTLALDVAPSFASKPPLSATTAASAADAADAARPEPIVFVTHGLTGGSHESYVRAALADLCPRGFRAVIMNSRGCNGSPVTSPKLYHVRPRPRARAPP